MKFSKMTKHMWNLFCIPGNSGLGSYGDEDISNVYRDFNLVIVLLFLKRC